MSIERDDTLKISVFYASTFMCQFMWWLKFQNKHVTLLIFASSIAL